MVIKNGKVVTSDSITESDIRILEGKIVLLEKSITTENEEVIDASGRYIIPGGVDIHTHMNLDTGDAVAVDDFYTGTAAALKGGTTTIVDHMGFGPPGCPLDHQLDYYHTISDGIAAVDYSFHGVIQHVDDDVLEKMGTLKERGLTSYKIYTTYNYSLSDNDIYRVLERASELGLVVCAHPEDDEMISSFTEDLRKKGCMSPVYYPESRPAVCEASAVKRLAGIAKKFPGVRLYIVHISSEEALNEVIKSREDGLTSILAETCPQYLYLDESLYKGEDALKYILSPPLRDRANNDILFTAVKNRDIQNVATDHCPFNYNAEKQRGRDDFTKCPKGLPSVQLRMSLMISRALSNIDITLNDVVRSCCENPSRIFGLYPEKGVIRPGSDADLVIFDPEEEWTVHHRDLIENVDYTPYENIHLRGKIDKVVFRGRVFDSRSVAEKGFGRYLARK